MSVPATGSAGVRMQHLIPATLILLLAGIVAWLSFTREPADAFLFPRLISSVMLLLAAWNFIRAMTGLARVGEGISMATLKAILPGILIMLLLVFLAAKTLGFYVASTMAFFSLFSLYDPAPHSAVTSWLKRLGVTLGFMLVIYALFSLLLKVQTPRGLFF
ncbi:MAG: tripartite tricarboxylate transporter TctB family protein [Granulosicoccus sp.]